MPGGDGSGTHSTHPLALLLNQVRTKYSRPDNGVHEGVSALGSLHNFWDDSALGWAHQTGFLLVYDMLRGDVDVRFFASDHTPSDECPPVLTSPADGHGPGQWIGSPTRADTVKLASMMLDASILQATRNWSIPFKTTLVRACIVPSLILASAGLLTGFRVTVCAWTSIGTGRSCSCAFCVNRLRSTYGHWRNIDKI